MTPDAKSPQDSLFAPMRHAVFTVLWAATVLGNTGTFLRDVASVWLVADLSTSPAAVAAIQAAGTLPIFLFAIPARVLTDVLERRPAMLTSAMFTRRIDIACGSCCVEHNRPLSEARQHNYGEADCERRAETTLNRTHRKALIHQN